MEKESKATSMYYHDDKTICKRGSCAGFEICHPAYCPDRLAHEYKHYHGTCGKCDKTHIFCGFCGEEIKYKNSEGQRNLIIMRDPNGIEKPEIFTHICLGVATACGILKKRRKRFRVISKILQEKLYK